MRNGVRLSLFAQLEKGACAPKCTRRLGSSEGNVVSNVEVIAFSAESVSFRQRSKTRFGEDEVTFLWFSAVDDEIFAQHRIIVLGESSCGREKLTILHHDSARGYEVALTALP